MGDNLQWVFSLTDKMSGPAKDIARNLRMVENVTKAINRTPLHLTDAANKRSLSSRMFSKMVNTAGNFFGPKGARAVLGTASALVKADEALGHVGMSLGGVVMGGATAATAAIAAMGATAVYAGVKLSSMALEYGTAGAKFALDTAAFREDTLLGLQAMLKSKDAARQLYEQSVKFAAVTPFDTKEVIGMGQSLVGMGFKPDELKRVMTAVGDMAAAKGMDKGIISRLSIAMGQIKAKGRLQGDEAMQLMEAGLNQGELYQQIGKLMGGKTTDAVRKLQEQGKINSDIAIEAIIRTAEKGFGGTMDLKSGGLSGLMSTLQSRPFDLVDRVLGNTGGLANFSAKIKDIVKSLTEVLDPDAATGSRITLILSKIGLAFSKAVPSADDVATLVDKIVAGVERLVPEVEKLADEFGQTIKKFMPKDSEGIEGFGRTVINVLRMVNAFVGGFAEGIGTTLGGAFGSLNGHQDDVEKMRANFEKMGDMIGKAVGKLWEMSQAVADAAAKIGGLLEKLDRLRNLGKPNPGDEPIPQPGEEGDGWWAWMQRQMAAEPPEDAMTYLANAAWDSWETGNTQAPGAAEGNAVADGFIQAIFGRTEDARAAGSALGAATQDGLATRIDAHSPSRVFAQYGEWSAEGFIQGLGAPDIEGAIRQTFAIPSGVLGGGVGGGSRVTVGSVNVSAPLHLSGADTETAKAAQDAVQRLLPSAVADAFEQMAAELGLA